LCCLLIAAVSFAQSGRRVPKRPETPLPPAGEGPSKSPEEKKEPDKPKLSVLVVRDISFDPGFGGAYGDIPARGCAERLRESLALEVILGREMNRKEASDHARDSENTYVVWMEVRSDDFRSDPNSLGSFDPNRIYVNYVLYTPKTGKAKTQGRVFLSQAASAGDIGVGLPTPRNAGMVNFLLKKAGVVTAERVMNAMGVAAPPKIAAS
jgi:hypothetical protein